MVLDALIKIKNEMDSTLTFRRSCREGELRPGSPHLASGSPERLGQPKGTDADCRQGALEGAALLGDLAARCPSFP